MVPLWRRNDGTNNYLDEAKVYLIGDIVIYENNKYKCIKTCRNRETPTNTLHWEKIIPMHPFDVLMNTSVEIMSFFEKCEENRFHSLDYGTDDCEFVKEINQQTNQVFIPHITLNDFADENNEAQLIAFAPCDIIDDVVCWVRNENTLYLKISLHDHFKHTPEDVEFFKITKYLIDLVVISLDQQISTSGDTKCYDKYNFELDLPQDVIWTWIDEKHDHDAIISCTRDDSKNRDDEDDLENKLDKFFWHIDSIRFNTYVSPQGKSFEMLNNLNEIFKLVI